MKKSLFILFIGISLQMNAQNFIVHKDTISWDKDLIKQLAIPESQDIPVMNLLSFSGAQYLDDENPLPYYYSAITIPSDVKDLKLQIKESSLLGNSVIGNIEGSFDSLMSTPKLFSKIHTGRNEKFLYIWFIPLIKENGQIKKINKFEISCNYDSERQKTANLKSTHKFANNSVLASGEWYKVRFEKTGIYKITYNELTNLGIDNPQNVRIYGNSHGQLSYENDVPRMDDLAENPLFMFKGSDNQFNSGDYILFYAEGPDIIYYSEDNKNYRYKNHLYSDAMYYFFTDDFGPGKRISQGPTVSSYDTIITTSSELLYHELENINIIESGRRFYGETFNDVKDEHTINFTLKDIVTSQPINIYSAAAAGSKSYTDLEFYLNNNLFSTITFAPQWIYTAGTEGSFIKDGYVSSENFNIRIFYDQAAISDKAWLDFIQINAARNLVYHEDQMRFRNKNLINSSKAARFEITNAKPTLKVWNVTDPHNVKIISGTLTGTKYTFNTNASEPSEFIAFDDNVSFLKPVWNAEENGLIETQNLHGMQPVNYMIITHPDFMSTALNLAELHETHNNLSVDIVTPQQIYNEFSSGAPDVSAIRDFARMMYNKTNPNDKEALKYILLLGDGSYENKGDVEHAQNYILTYQSYKNSLRKTDSYVADDFFTYLDYDEGESGAMDVGIGRWPVTTNEQAQNIYNKVRQYMLFENGNGHWQNTMLFVGDDEDGQGHMEASDIFAEHVLKRHPGYSVKKVYLDAYDEVAGATGQAYPEVNKTIYENIQKGLLLLNYVGHGGEVGLAVERIITIPDINSWQNKHLPVFFTATCEFARFDNHELLSAGELTLLKPDGGAIALFTTTRIVYSSDNEKLNQSFLNIAFEANPEGENYSFGDLFRIAKNNHNVPNSRNFQLLGDPGLKFAYPVFHAITESINDAEVAVLKDTLSAFSKVKVKGYVADLDSNIINSFNGTIYPVVLGKEQIITTNNNGGEDLTPMTFKDRPNTLFRGKATVENGRFEYEFIIPKDISYAVGNAKIIYFFHDDQIYGNGSYDNLLIGGSSKNTLNDQIGPSIELFMNDSNFISGSITNESPKIFARLSDASGINTTGTGIGHDLSAILDENNSQLIILNDFYESDVNTYQQGQIVYPLKDLKSGHHTLRLKAWDIANNSSSEIIEFYVSESEEMALNHVLNYPNPFTTRTTFMFEHNQPNTDLDVLIQVFTVSGKLVKTIKRQINTEGFGPVETEWNGKDDFGDKIGRGVYIYKVKLRNPEGKTVEKYEKLVILN